ncbi:MAG TPA: hypothetical protein PKY59_03635 [Pyrinomonadaceae bacterium]|nr:hypothetical protein [Pyrinomonadaceae bacterium]
MAKVTYLKNVSDNNVKTVIQRIATALGRDITVHSGDRSTVVKGSSPRSLHLHKCAADFHIQGMSDAQGFKVLKERTNELFDASESYELIHHGVYTATGGEHLHLGRYGDDRKGFVDFKAEGLSPQTSGNYHDIGSERKYITTPKGGMVSPAVVKGVTMDASVLSPSVGIAQSVGIGGNNLYNDVFLVQHLLNQSFARLKETNFPFEKMRALAVDGDCGRLTKQAITIFQRDIMRMSEPDGRIDPGGRTIRALYVAAYNSIDKILPRINRVKTQKTTTLTGNGNWNGVLAWGTHPNVSTAFRDKAIQISNELGIKDPSWLMTVMAFETGRTFSPSKKNEAGSSGTGLIQFMKSTIDGQTRNGKFYAGLGEKLGIKHADLAGMTALRQLDVVKAYFQQFGAKASQAKDVDDLYFLVLLPSAFGKPDDASMFTKGTTAYSQNSGLDSDRDGRVTVAETARKIREMLREGFDQYPYKYK